VGFSIRDWVQKKEKCKKISPQWLFIAAMPEQRETLKPILTGLMSSAINSLLGMPPDPARRLWFVIDELASLHKQESLPKALAEIRKYGGCITVGIQNIPQLQSQYGYAETKSLTSLFNTKVVFRNGDPETAKHMSQMLGEQEVKESVEGISYGANSIRDGVSLNEQQRLKPVVSANDIMVLDDLEAYLKLSGNLPVAKVRFEVEKAKKVCPGYIPACLG
jgi:type IV secretory pathway TraG/TraD family ATPase VirD4